MKNEREADGDERLWRVAKHIRRREKKLIHFLWRQGIKMVGKKLGKKGDLKTVNEDRVIDAGREGGGESTKQRKKNCKKT